MGTREKKKGRVSHTLCYVCRGPKEKETVSYGKFTVFSGGRVNIGFYARVSFMCVCECVCVCVCFICGFH
jgi:hypothetical protein